MASYRFSAIVMKRSAGRSATAAAAYRSAERVSCERYGETHDYTRKQGVTHSEIMAPDNAPDWMRNRADLWNAVEAAEKRKDAQLAREIQLSLPHELNDEQRRDMVRQYVHEQFVSRGMIADVNIHAPHRDGDQRNHHAHIMLTMRELTGEGFGGKDRSWNDRANIERWREEWAHTQNREFERLGIEARVDHRSFEDQGIDRESQTHEGPAATSKKRRQEQSRIGDENEGRQAANENRADAHAAALKLGLQIERERQRFQWWADQKTEQLQAAQAHSQLDLERAHELQADQLEDKIQGVYGEHLQTVQADAAATLARLDTGGVVGAFRALTGRTRSDRRRLEEAQATIHDTEQRMGEMRGKLAKAQEVQRARLEEQQAERTRQQEEGIERARERKEDALNTKVKQWWAERSQPDTKAAGEWWKTQDRSEHEHQEKPPRERQPRDNDRGHEPER